MYQQEIKMKENRSFVKCAICKQEIIGKHRFIELAMNYGVICPECDSKFNDDEIELISNILTAFGG
jgi:DNA-directed RNA polymerase subunit RPC12/RpoP